MKKLLLLLSLFLTIHVSGQTFFDAVSSQATAAAPGGFDGGMITKGDFAGITQSASVAGDDWGTGSGWSIADGKALYNDVNNYSMLKQLSTDMVSPTQANTAYVVDFDISDLVSGFAVFSITESTGNVTYKSAGVGYANGHTQVTFTTPVDIGVGGIGIKGSTSSDSSFKITNIKMVAQ